MAKFYQKTHKLKKAATNHSKQIMQGWGKVGIETTKIGFKATYYYPKKIKK